MQEQQSINYNRIAEAIQFIKKNFKDQPTLNQVAEAVHLSPFHFQRLFSEWAGVSPKKFLQYVTIQHSKQLLKENTLFETALESGLSGTSRLHDLFIRIEGMTPGEYKNGGSHLSIKYNFEKTPFGEVLIAATQKGICHLAFIEDKLHSLEILSSKFPKANFEKKKSDLHQNTLNIFNQNWDRPDQIKLHLKGTPFQLKVWEALLKIPIGQLSTYGSLANYIKKPKALRAVGTAIGSNPVAFLIPCHRVIRSNGEMGGYMWGTTRKTAIIGWECSKLSFEKAA